MMIFPEETTNLSLPLLMPVKAAVVATVAAGCGRIEIILLISSSEYA